MCRQMCGSFYLLAHLINAQAGNRPNEDYRKRTNQAGGQRIFGWKQQDDDCAGNRGETYTKEQEKDTPSNDFGDPKPEDSFRFKQAGSYDVPFF